MSMFFKRYFMFIYLFGISYQAEFCAAGIRGRKRPALCPYRARFCSAMWSMLIGRSWQTRSDHRRQGKNGRERQRPEAGPRGDQAGSSEASSFEACAETASLARIGRQFRGQKHEVRAWPYAHGTRVGARPLGLPARPGYATGQTRQDEVEALMSFVSGLGRHGLSRDKSSVFQACGLC